MRPDAAYLGRAPFQVIQRALISAPLVGRSRYIKILWGISDCRVSYVSPVNRTSRRNRCPPSTRHIAARQTAIQHPDLTLYASLELSRATWLVTSLAWCGASRAVVKRGTAALQLVRPIPELDHEPQQRLPLFLAPGLAKLGMASPGGISEHSDVIHASTIPNPYNCFLDGCQDLGRSP